MRLYVCGLVTIALLMVFALPARADGPNLNLSGGGGAGLAIFPPGPVNITGNSGNGTDQISNVNVNGVMNALAFGGNDIGAKVNSAINALGSMGGTVYIPQGTYPFSTTIQCPVTGDIPINIIGAAHSTEYTFTGTVLQYTGYGDAINQMMIGNQNARGCQLRDLTLDGGASCAGTATTNPNCHTYGFHFGGTAYTRTANVMFRNFTDSCIMLDNQPDPQDNNGGHWTERYNFDRTTFSECGYGNVPAVAATHLYPNSSIYLHNSTGNVPGSGGNRSFMHGQMNVFFGLFGNQNGIVIDGNTANNSFGGQATGAVFEVNGNMNTDSTGSLFMLRNNSYMYGKLTNSPECMNSTPCTRMDIDNTSHVGIQYLGGMPGRYLDKIPFGADLQQAYMDTRMFSQMHATCFGAYGMNPGDTVELFNLLPGFSSAVAGLLAINGENSGNGTTSIYNMATVSCNQPGTVSAGAPTSSLALGKSQIIGAGVAFTLNETCHPTAVIGSGTATNPQYPAGTTTYTLVNNASVASFFTMSYLNILNGQAGPGGMIYPPTTAAGTYQAELCM